MAPSFPASCPLPLLSRTFFTSFSPISSLLSLLYSWRPYLLCHRGKRGRQKRHILLPRGVHPGGFSLLKAASPRCCAVAGGPSPSWSPPPSHGIKHCGQTVVTSRVPPFCGLPRGHLLLVSYLPAVECLWALCTPSLRCHTSGPLVTLKSPVSSGGRSPGHETRNTWPLSGCVRGTAT